MIAEGVGDGRAALAKVVEAHAVQDYFAFILDYGCRT